MPYWIREEAENKYNGDYFGAMAAHNIQPVPAIRIKQAVFKISEAQPGDTFQLIVENEFEAEQLKDSLLARFNLSSTFDEEHEKLVFTLNKRADLEDLFVEHWELAQEDVFYDNF